MSHVNLSEFRSNIARHLDRIEADRTELIVTRQGHEPVVVMPLAELEGLRETLHLLGNLVNADRLRRSIRELDAGEGAEKDLVE